MLIIFFVVPWWELFPNVAWHDADVLMSAIVIIFIYIYDCSQAELFDKFLHGSTLEECYSAVAAVANRWLDLLDVCKKQFNYFHNQTPFLK